MMYAKVGLFMLEKLYITSNLLALSYDFAECPCIIRSIWLFLADLKILFIRGVSYRLSSGSTWNELIEAYNPLITYRLKRLYGK